MKNKITIYAILILANLFLFSCGNANDEHAGHGNEHGEHEEETHEEGLVSLTKQQMEAIGVKLVQVEKRNMNIGVQVTGQLELAPQDRADISSILGGVIKSIKVIEGDVVTKGQVLATLEHPDFIQMQQDYINSENTLDYLEKDFERQKRLYEEKIGSGKEFQKLEAEYNNKKSEVKALKIKLMMLGLDASKIKNGTIYAVVSIVSPMKGIVSLVETNIGAYVAPLTKLFEVVNNEALHADFRVYEKDINKIRVGQKIHFTTASILEEEFEGEIKAISPVFEESPKSLHVHADISNNKKNLIPGMYIQGRIIAKNIMTTVLPEHAIVSEEEKTYVFIKEKDDNHNEHAEHAEHAKEEKIFFKMIEVITGFTSGGYIEVKLLSPLPENTQIVGYGAYYLLAEMGKGETEHEH